MRASHYFLPTLRETPADAELVSHRLLARGAFIRRLSAGVYSYLPLGLRVHDMIAQIVREEMNTIGGIEVMMPTLVPRELLEETGRDKVDVLFPLRDKVRREYFLGFTHEEPCTDIVRASVNSWRQLPLILYQITTKFRDEARPRGGLIRGREFTMKDSYSFDADAAGLDRSFVAHSAAYERIFRRCGLHYLKIDADPGDIGGTDSTEFMILAESGEDSVLKCDTCGYVVNAEKAAIGSSAPSNQHSTLDTQHATRNTQHSAIVPTPGAHTVAQVAEFLGVGADKIIKTIIVTAGGVPVAALIRGDRELNAGKLSRFLAMGPVAMADAATVETVTGAPVGFAGPVGLSSIRIVADKELRGASGMVVGANQADAHRVGVAPEVDFAVTDWADIRVALQGDRCGEPGCAGHYVETRGIEVAHIFKLGARYSHDMGARVQDESGEMRDVEMGCYGLGVSRTMAAAVEAHHDDEGICWPVSIAPFQVVVVQVNSRDEAQAAAAARLSDELEALGVDAIYDDRSEPAGVKFKDADLIGYPVRVVVGRSLVDGKVDVALRRDKASAESVPLADAAQHVARLIAAETPV